jgi:hypothetical protein
VQFWIRPSSNAVAIDDAAITGVDCSSIPTNVQLVHWYGASQTPSGEVLYNDRVAIREPFTDPTPYLTVINNWIKAAGGILPPDPVLGAATTPHSPTKLTTPTQSSTSGPYPPLTVSQAQAVKNNLIDGLFANKRQAPITFMGNQYDASDSEASAMANAISAAAKQNIDAITGSVDSAFSTYSGNVQAGLNGFAGTTGTAGSVNKAINDYHTNVNVAFGTMASNAQAGDGTVAGNVTTAFTSHANFLNSRLAQFNSDMSFDFTAFSAAISANIIVPINGAVAFPIGPLTNPALTIPAIAADAGQSVNGSSVAAPSTATTSVTAPTVNGPASITTVASPTIPWTPIGGTPQTMTFANFSALLKSITDRRATLQANRATLKNALNAMTTVAAVAAQDITAGW